MNFNSDPFESVGSFFSASTIALARDLTLKVIERASQSIKPGWSEEDARFLIQDLLRSSGFEKSWHAPQIRFGVNTRCAFGETGVKEVLLGENDIFFLDLGPIFQRHEGDVGRTFTVGNDPEMIQASRDAGEIWHQVRNRWFESKASGAELYSYAKILAVERGWELSLKEANGHRIADFPHAVKQRGTIEELMFSPAPSRWILEIQINHPTRSFGAFFEDLLR